MGSEFHSVIDLGKKEILKTSLDTFGILYLKAWLLPLPGEHHTHGDLLYGGLNLLLEHGSHIVSNLPRD